MSRELPARPDLEHLRKEAKQRLEALRRDDRAARLSDAQRLVARSYGFASWRQMKAAVDESTRQRVFEAARAGDVPSVRRALERGFHPGTTDGAGRTLHQIAKTVGHPELERMMRDYQERDGRPEGVKRAVQAIHAAAADGRVDDLRRLLDASPELLDARGVDRAGQTTLHRAAWNDRRDCVRLLLEYGVDVGIRDWGDNATALHGAAQRADVQVVRMLVEAGADVIGDGDDHQLGVLGWATCLGRVRDDIAAYLLGAGARLDIWSAIALGRAADVRRLVDADRSVLGARMSRNEHRRTPLHHAVVVNRADMVRLLIDLGADVHARDAAGNTALTLSALGAADAAVPAMLEQAGATLDLVAAVSLARYDVAERRLLDEPDTMALHVLVAARKPEAVRWLIEHGVDVNAKRVLWDCNCTALHITAEHGLVDVARMLLDAGADPSIHDDKYDATVLEWTHYCDQPRIAELLRSRGITA